MHTESNIVKNTDPKMQAKRIVLYLFLSATDFTCLEKK